MKNRSLKFIFGVVVLVNTMMAAQDKQPNIILIYADDLGRGLLGTYGQKIISTPNIDKLANEGLRFDNAYGSHYCSPARASLLTGMHDCRTDQYNITQAGIYMQLDNGLSLDEIKDRVNAVAMPAKKDAIFLAEVAQKAGYTTAEFGKLEWGFSTTPERLDRHGWDYHYGYYDHQRCHGFYPSFLFENGKKVDIPGNTLIDCGKNPEGESPENYKKRWDMTGRKVYSETIIMDKLLDYLEVQSKKETEQPFFVYFPSQLPHGPISIPEVAPEFKNNPNLSELEKEYASMVKMLDTDVGRIYTKLEELGVLDNTILVFTGDNGHELYYHQKDRCDKTHDLTTGQTYNNISTKFYSHLGGDVFDGNDGMAGIKRSNWEGGVRVPLVWYWKGKIQPGTISNQMVSNYDFLNTLAEIVGGKTLKEKDGVSYAKTLFGKKSKERTYTVYSSTMGPALVTKEGWKLRYLLKKNVFQLYYLPDDYKEENDLSSKYKKKTESLKQILYKECNNNWQNGVSANKVKP
ncbi:sulfatase-like hydrolase/transferase [Mariniflexile sp. AS56]|uniref:sulfatase-like hydrolase/transferase n=1 Tax=Mariniflexile sp. AS56 TaxID=3063957 RepID=UPI0026EFB08D|nr:sulfatase-like hydrolase/transferase [Mariniflexile sp. AS56]MDO7172374.1 sulfatase-like hydrolase/transferase [Mariniflexile sp. AS56]